MTDMTKAEIITRLELLTEHARVAADRIAALEKRVLGASTSIAAAGEAARGVYVPKPTCLMCGADKEGRRTLTCAACSTVRVRALKPGGDRSVLMLGNCGNCGTDIGRSTNYLCKPCGASFREWKGL